MAPQSWPKEISSILGLMLRIESCCRRTRPPSWIEKGLQLYKNESYEEAAAAFDRAIELEPENLNAWLHKSVAMTTLGMKITGGGMNLGAEDREASLLAAFGEATAANDRAVEIAPENANRLDLQSW